jgi:hypothetical protein
MQILTWPSMDWKSLNFKNLDREKKMSALDTKDNLDKFQKLISILIVEIVETSTLTPNTKSIYCT